MTLGPIELDATLRTEISLSLSQRRLSQTVFLRSNDNEEKECLLRLEEGLIKIAHCYSEANYAFSYSISEPMIVINPKDTTRMAIQFVGSYESDLARFKKKLFNGDLE